MRTDLIGRASILAVAAVAKVLRPCPCERAERLGEIRETEGRLLDGQSKKLMTTYSFHGTQVSDVYNVHQVKKFSTSLEPRLQIAVNNRLGIVICTHSRHAIIRIIWLLEPGLHHILEHRS